MDGFRERVVAFLEDSLSTGVACPAYGAILPPDLHDEARRWQRTIAEAGMAALHWPVAYGGQGLSHGHTKVWFEECARADVAPVLNIQGIILAGEAILRFGTDDQKANHLPRTATGETLWCQLFSEPGAGSDLAGLQTTAAVDGDQYIVNGQKVWSSNAQFAEEAILMARTDLDAPKHRGISFFLVDMNLPGIEVRPLTQITGDQEFCEVFMTDVHLPLDALLGESDRGWSVAMSVLVDERGSFGEAGAISLSRELDKLAANNSGTDPVTNDRLSRVVGEGRALMALLQRLGADPSMAPAAKLARTELSSTARELQASMRGPSAMLDDEATRELLYAAGMRLAGGTSEIQRNIIGEQLLGLPREPRADDAR